MHTFEKDFYQFNDNSEIYNSAAKSSVKKKDFNKECLTYFKHYNTDNDKKLSESELEELMLDLENADTDEDSEISNSEINKLLKNIKGGKGKVTKTERKNFFKFLNTIQKKYTDKISNNSDGIIQEADQQGISGVGDCWLLSQIRGMSNTKWGAEAIKDSISKDKNGTYKVNLKGVNFEAELTQDEIDKAKKYGQTLQNGDSSPYTKGDLDVLLLELAVEKYFNQEISEGNLVRREKTLYGNQLAGTTSLQYMLTGKTGHEYYFVDNPNNVTDTSKMSEYGKNCWKNVQDYASLADGDKAETAQKLLKNIFSSTEDVSVICGLKVSKSISHAYTIKDIKLDNDGNIEEVLLINPTASQITAHYPFDEFLEKMKSISVTNESNNYDALNEGFVPHPKRVVD